MKVKSNKERWEVLSENGVVENYRSKLNAEVTIQLKSVLEGEAGGYEMVYRFMDTWHTFTETNSRTYKSLKGAQKWAIENGFELVDSMSWDEYMA